MTFSMDRGKIGAAHSRIGLRESSEGKMVALIFDFFFAEAMGTEERDRSSSRHRQTVHEYVFNTFVLQGGEAMTYDYMRYKTVADKNNNKCHLVQFSSHSNICSTVNDGPKQDSIRGYMVSPAPFLVPPSSNETVWTIS